MIFLVTKQQELLENPNYTIISEEKSLKLMKDWDIVQYDSETDGRNPHINNLLCVQFGNDKADIRIVVDCTTCDINKYKEILETKFIVGHNLKFDIQFLFKYKIIPTRIYDTMIVEQLLYLGYPSGVKHYSLKAVADEYLDVNIDKTVRGEIIWRGLDSEVVLYAAGDVTYLEQIMQKQLAQCKMKHCVEGAKVECNAITAVAYIEWCGILLDVTKWQEKMKKDVENLNKSLETLNNYCLSNPKLQKWVKIDRQGDLFTGFDTTPKWTVDWQKKEAINVIQALGFNTKTQDKKTGEDKDSILEKLLMSQKGIDDTFLKYYFDYQGNYKLTTSFGQGHLDAINPITGRLHTNIWQIGASSGRTSCGGGEDDDLAKYKHLPKGSCKLLNLQQLPHDEETRACFIAPKGYKFVSADFSSEEARLAGDIYQDEAILKMFREGIDSHSMYAKIFFKDELKDIDVHDVKKLRPDLRNLAKGPEFALNFGGGAFAIMQAIQCSKEEADTIIKNYEEGFQGTAEFAKKASRFVRQNGYVLIEPRTGNKMYWWDHDVWKKRQESFTTAFWEEYRNVHKPAQDEVAQEVSMHFKAASKYDRMARNSPTQGTAAIVLKDSLHNLFKWICDNGYFDIIHICIEVHDEIDCDCPEEIAESFAKTLGQIMEQSAAKYCKSLSIPAETSIGLHWIH